jgi:hypothetical protein
VPVDIDVKVVVDKNGARKITFNKKALMEAPLSQLINDTSTSVQVYRTESPAYSASESAPSKPKR